MQVFSRRHKKNWRQIERIKWKRNLFSSCYFFRARKTCVVEMQMPRKYCEQIDAILCSATGNWNQKIQLKIHFQEHRISGREASIWYLASFASFNLRAFSTVAIRSPSFFFLGGGGVADPFPSTTKMENFEFIKITWNATFDWDLALNLRLPTATRTFADDKHVKALAFTPLPCLGHSPEPVNWISYVVQLKRCKGRDREIYASVCCNMLAVGKFEVAKDMFAFFYVFISLC